MSALTVSRLDAGYGDFQALFGVSLDIPDRSTVAIIGANGAGKSTLLRAIVGQVRVMNGSVHHRGDDLADVPTHRRVERGIALVPEGRKLFPSLTVEENLLVGAHLRRPGPWSVAKVLEVFPLIERLLKRPAGKLSGGEQQAIAIGRALMSNPEVLLLDEVSLGLAPVVVKDLYAALPGITAAGTTLVVVEQDITLALGVADHVYCMLEGRVSLDGRPADLSREAISAAYFGVVEQPPTQRGAAS